MSHRFLNSIKTSFQSVLIGAVCLGIALSPASAQAPQANVQLAEASDDGRSYSTVRMLDGDATLFAENSDERVEVDLNYPIQTGDRLWVPPGARVQVALADGALIAVGGGSEVVFDQMGASLDSEDDTTRIRLLQGRLHLTLDEYFVGTELPIIDTANARLFAQSERASFAVWANHSDWTQVTVRDGVGEVLTPSGSSLVRTDEELTVTGEFEVSVQLAAAARPQDLELWTSEAGAAFSRESYEGLEQPLAGTASLTDHGDWVDVEGSTAWRPRGVDAEWRPYGRGRWVTTRGGLYWSAFDPWSPVTFHYGGWDLHPRWGWLWYPGWRYAPAHVAWYFGPSYSAWVPLGYYNRFYGFNRLGFGFRFGLWGVAGGGLWDPFYDWTFCPTPYFGYRRGFRHFRSGRYYHRRGDRLGRGYVTTDTRHVTRGHLEQPSKIYDDLSRRRGRDQLTDVTPLLARKKDIPDSVRRNVLVAGGTQAAPKVVRDSIRRDGIPRTSQTGVKRSTVRQVAADRTTATGTKSTTTVRRSTVSETTTRQREPSKVIVDGVRRGSGTDTTTGKTSTWRSSDRTVTRGTPRGDTSKTVRSRPPTSTRSVDRTSTASGGSKTTRRDTASPTVRRPPPKTTSSRPPASTRTTTRGSSTRSTTSKPSTTSRPPRATTSRPPARSARPATTSRPPARSARPATTSRPPARSTQPSSSSRGSVSRSSVRSGSSSSRPPRASRPPSRSSGSSRSKVSRPSAPPSSRSSARSSRGSGGSSRSSARSSSPSGSSRSKVSRSSSSRSSRSSARSSGGSRSSSRSSARSSSRSSSSRSKSSSAPRSKPSKPPAEL